MNPKSLHTVQGDLERIENRYNGDNDMIPNGPMVTWAEYDLMQAVKVLIGHIDVLYQRIGELEKK